MSEGFKPTAENTEGGIPSKRERMKKIFQGLSEAPAAGSALEAYTLVEEQFRIVEGDLPITDQMVTRPFKRMGDFQFGEKKIYYSDHNVSILFLGENGAIEVRLLGGYIGSFYETLFKENPEFAREKLSLAFAKPGADGKGLWED